MKITHISSATVLIENKSTKILTDPWLIGDVYYGSWTHYPPLEDSSLSQLNDVDYIYISHIHPDHMSRETLEKLNPEIRLYNQPKTLTYEASIKSSFLSDTYLTMSNISETDIFNIKFQKKPFMNFIWFSVLLISFGGILNFFNRKKEI